MAQEFFFFFFEKKEKKSVMYLTLIRYSKGMYYKTFYHGNLMCSKLLRHLQPLLPLVLYL